MYLIRPPTSLLTKIGKRIENQYIEMPAKMALEEYEAFLTRVQLDLEELNEHQPYGPTTHAADITERLLRSAVAQAANTKHLVTASIHSGENGYLFGVSDKTHQFTQQGLREQLNGHATRIYVNNESAWVLAKPTGIEFDQAIIAEHKKHVQEYKEQGLYKRMKHYREQFSELETLVDSQT